MPDASMMPELCAVLKINLNELFSGERLNMENYKEMAEQHLLELHKLEKTANKKLLALETVIGCVCTASFVLLILAVSLITMALPWKIALIAAGIVIFAVGLGCCIKIEHDAGYYECPECGKSYVPDLKSVIFAPHIGRVRKMTCPYCGKRAYHKKVLTKEN